MTKGDLAFTEALVWFGFYLSGKHALLSSTPPAMPTAHTVVSRTFSLYPVHESFFIAQTKSLSRPPKGEGFPLHCVLGALLRARDKAES